MDSRVPIRVFQRLPSATTMIGLLQRVSSAKVEIGTDTVGAIGRGLMVLIGVERGDTEREGERLVERLVGYRVFPDTERRMNRSVADIGGGLLLVPQFTLPADTRKGARPSLSNAAPPDAGKRLFDHVVSRARVAPDRRNRSIRRPHASHPHQRRTGDLYIAGRASGMTGGIRYLRHNHLRRDSPHANPSSMPSRDQEPGTLQPDTRVVSASARASRFRPASFHAMPTAPGRSDWRSLLRHERLGPVSGHASR